MYEEKQRIIVSSVSGIAETGAPTVLALDVSNDELGRVVCDHLLAFEPETPANLPSNKTEWPAFIASGARSVSGFESHSWQVLVETVGDCIRINARPLKSLHHEISVEGIERPHHANLGAVIRRVLAGALALREKGVI
ncbi:MAG: hypothetical protein DCF16_16175 [Alphaproteobacteria bacterium]|nr:MAG: hypothetical protein DCF16_16175 [Alphaproteobacteria bacterium]